MKVELSPHEARVIGCLIEKEVSTPDQYPQSLNALTNACNQKSNRDPVLELDERQVQEIVDALMKRHLVSDRSGYGGRVTKYKHLFCNTQFGSLQFTEHERGIVCELLLRGPQTAGELRTRTARLCKFNEAAEVETALQNLMTRTDGPFLLRLERAPGEREVRYAHLFSGTPVVAPRATAADESSAPSARADRDARIAALEAAVAELRRELDELKRRSP
ncbi:MAG TPA: DUF480 domain-containing protein [Steroidobacteraceae bacterium]|nr:DUF480 domain-containing protein [Steroidobacteraceae bacterium]